MGGGMRSPLHDAPIQENSKGFVPGERSLEILVEMPAIAGHDDELPDPLGLFGVAVGRRRAAVKAPPGPRRGGLPQKSRERCPHHAPTARAGLGANSEALVTIKTQGELSQREMHARRKLSYPADHRRVTSGTGTGPSDPTAATVTSAKSVWPGLPDAAPSAASRARRARSCRRDSWRAGRAAGFRRPGGLDPRAATARPEARTAPRSTGARHREGEASLHQSHPRQDSIANLIPESNFQKISNLCAAGQELAWRVSDRADQSGASAARPARDGFRISSPARRVKNVGNSGPPLRCDEKSLIRRWLACSAVLVRVVAFG